MPIQECEGCGDAFFSPECEQCDGSGQDDAGLDCLACEGTGVAEIACEYCKD